MTTVDDLLTQARGGMRRLDPEQTRAAVAAVSAGGVEAWLAVGLPTSTGPEDVRY